MYDVCVEAPGSGAPRAVNPPPPACDCCAPFVALSAHHCTHVHTVHCVHCTQTVHMLAGAERVIYIFDHANWGSR